MTPLTQVPFGELVAALSRVENAISLMTLPSLDTGCASTVDKLARLITHEQLLTDELESRVTARRHVKAWCERRKEHHSGLPTNILRLVDGSA